MTSTSQPSTSASLPTQASNGGEARAAHDNDRAQVDQDIEGARANHDGEESRPDRDGKEAQADHNTNLPEIPWASSAPKKKKKKNKSGKSAAKRGPTAMPKSRGTGFEEFFADPPMTATEAIEEKYHLYASELPFEERIQTCIQRFRARRRLSPEQTRYFDDYLFLGGIDTTGNAFGGLDPKEMKALTPAQRMEASAHDAVHTGSAADDKFYQGDNAHWSVDFTGVLAGFLSTSLPVTTGGDADGVETAIALIENFLKYILHHDVCPEYHDDVTRALQLCADARSELPLLNKLRRALPGSFHLAASDLFTPPSPEGWSGFGSRLPKGSDAKTIFYSACALLGEADVLKAAQEGRVAVAKEFDCVLELVRVEMPRDILAAGFRRLLVDGASIGVGPIGKAFFKPTIIEDGWVHPPTSYQFGDGGECWLYFEEVLLAAMKPGIKMALTIVELEAGVHFVKNVADVVPTFYTFLPQALMKYYKQQRPNERPAPSVDNPHAEEEQHARENHAD